MFNRMKRWVPIHALKNVSLLTIGDFISNLAGFFYGVFGAYILGASGFGQLVLIQSMVRMISHPINFRLGSPVLKVVKERLEDDRTLRNRDSVRSVILLQGIGSLAFGLVFFLFLWFYAPRFELFESWQLALGFFALAEILHQVRKFVASLIVAYEEYAWRASYNVWSSLCRDGLVVVFMMYGGVQGACLGFFVSELLIAGFIAVMSYRIWGGLLFEALADPDFRLVRGVRVIYENARSNYVSALLSKPYKDVVHLMIGSFVSSSATGYYNVARKFKKIFQFLVRPVKTYLFPRFVEKWSREDRDEFYYTLRKYFYQMTPVFVVGATGIVLAAPWLVPLLYSSDFREAIPLVVILVPFFALESLFNVFSDLAFVVSRQVALLQESLLVLLVGLPVACGLILAFDYYGAAWALAFKIILLTLFRSYFFMWNFGWKWIVPR